MGTRRADRVEQNYLLFETRESKSAKKALQKQIEEKEPEDKLMPIPKLFRIKDCDQVIVVWHDGTAAVCHTDP